MMAFIPVIASSSFTPQRASLLQATSKAPGSCTPTMSTANFPADVAAPYGKYLQFLPPGRVNKAPVITINNVGNEAHNSVDVRLADLVADQSAAATMLAGLHPSSEKAPAAALWSRYYDPETVNEAPLISMNGGADMQARWQYVCVVQTTVPTNEDAGAAILASAPLDPDHLAVRTRIENDYRAAGRLDMAPYVSVTSPSPPDSGSVKSEDAIVGLNLYAAKQILAQYRS